MSLILTYIFEKAPGMKAASPYIRHMIQLNLIVINSLVILGDRADFEKLTEDDNSTEELIVQMMQITIQCATEKEYYE
jgi:hypothetical protein